jgi:hypothetical protein
MGKKFRHSGNLCSGMSFESRKFKIRANCFINSKQEVTMKFLFGNAAYEKIILLKKTVHKIIKLIAGRDDDQLGNSCLIL